MAFWSFYIQYTDFSWVWADPWFGPTWAQTLFGAVTATARQPQQAGSAWHGNFGLFMANFTEKLDTNVQGKLKPTERQNPERCIELMLVTAN